LGFVMPPRRIGGDEDRFGLGDINPTVAREYLLPLERHVAQGKQEASATPASQMMDQSWHSPLHDSSTDNAYDNHVSSRGEFIYFCLDCGSILCVTKLLDSVFFLLILLRHFIDVIPACQPCQSSMKSFITH